MNGQTWYLISSDGITGWVLGDELKVTGTAAPTATVIANAAPSWNTTEARGTMVTTASRINVRAAAGKANKRLGSIGKGKTVTWYDTTEADGETWYYVRYEDLSGWVLGSLLKAGATEKPTAVPTATSAAQTQSLTMSNGVQTVRGYLTVTKSKVNVRAEADTSAKRLCGVSKGDELPWYAKQTVGGSTWYYVQVNGKQGWILGDCVTPRATATPVPTAVPTPVPTPTPAPAVTATAEPDPDAGSLTL